MHQQYEAARRSLCSFLGAQTLSNAPTTYHDKWLHESGAPPATPTLPCGTVWGLINSIKVLHQYTQVLSEAASNNSAHAHALHPCIEACVRGLEWMEPLLAQNTPPQEEEEYRKHVDLWRASNPGLFGNDEAMYHTHQAYTVEDPNLTKLLVHSILPTAKTYDVAIAQSILRARPASYDEFLSDFTNWRDKGAYHPLRLAALHMPSSDLWAPPECAHELDDWQSLLDDFNRSGFLTPSRLSDFCERLQDRSPLLCNHICGVLDRVCVLMGVKSNSTNTQKLQTLLTSLHFDPDPKAPYTHSLLTWMHLKQNLEDSLPPALLCPALCQSYRDGWGYPRLTLSTHHNMLLIHSGPLQWIDKSSYAPSTLSAGILAERLQDILLRLGETATSPELAHLMLQPQSLSDCLSNIPTETDLTLITNRARILQSMSNPNPDLTSSNSAFLNCIRLMVACLPSVTPQTFPAPLSLLAWRIDCPQQAILYTGRSSNIDLSNCPPHVLPKTLLFDRMQSKTISGISVLSDTLDPPTSLRACIVDEIVRPHADFALHPFHQIPITKRRGEDRLFRSDRHPHNQNQASTQQPIQTPTQPSIQTSTVLAETVSIFSGPTPSNHISLPLHSSQPWDKDHIDDRYAETQIARNGLRYRDWVTMYRTPTELHQSRLAAHHISITQLFHTHFPLSDSGKHTWISVASTLPAETRVLRHLGGKNQLDALKRSVENRFTHDTKLLPTWHPEDTVSPSNIEVYSDPTSNQVLLVYAPVSFDGSRLHLEVMSFRL